MKFKVKVFLSHSVQDKDFAIRLASKLRDYPFIEIFMAPDDIKAGTFWVDELKYNLKNSDVVLALLTENYHKSDWTEQEIGLAWAFEKRILALSLDGNMGNGYVKNFQIQTWPIDFNAIHLSKLTIDLYPTIENKDEFAEGVLKLGLTTSGSFEQANAIASVIQRLVEHLKPELINYVIKAYEQNSQVTYAIKWNNLIEESFIAEKPFFQHDYESRKKLLQIVKENNVSMYQRIQNKIDVMKKNEEGN